MKKIDLNSLSYDSIMKLKLSDLKLSINKSILQKRINILYNELELRGIKYKPHIWISDEWFTPDDIPGFAVPFYLLHPKLLKLEKIQMYEAEGEREKECMKILRHETGHAISHAYKVYDTKEWNKVFGKYRKPYPLYYTPNPVSKDFVVHLNAWYAQAHPFEDFAETFAVWLNPKSRWRKKYSGWSALNKLEYIDNLMKQINAKDQINKTEEEFESLKDLNYTIKDYYDRKKKFYSMEWPETYDNILTKIFSADNEGLSSTLFLRKMKKQIRSYISETLDIPQYTINQLIMHMAARCRELKLKQTGDESETIKKILVMLTAQLSSYIHTGYHKIPL